MSPVSNGQGEPALSDITDLQLQPVSDDQHPSLGLNNMNSQPVSNTHEMTHSSGSNNNERFKCTLCNMSFSYKFVLNRHMKTHLNEKLHVCELCQKAFSQRSNLTRHMLLHNNLVKQPFICKDCGQTFTRKKNFHNHLKIHVEKKEIECDNCNKKFNQKSNLIRHKKIHEKTRIPYKCNQCPEEFLRKRDLLKHKKIHIKILIKHKCEKCDDEFPLKQDLLLHKKKVHFKAPIKYKCEECPKEFSQKGHWRKHTKIHLKPKHSCNQCNEAFWRKSELFRHIRISHVTSTKRSATSTQSLLHKKTIDFKRKNAMNMFFITTFNSNENNNHDFSIFFNDLKSDIHNELKFLLQEKRGIKWYIVVHATLFRTNEEGDLEYVNPHFRSKVMISLTDDSMSDHIDDAFAKVINSFEEFTKSGSDWTLHKINTLDLHTVKYHPL